MFAQDEKRNENRVLDLRTEDIELSFCSDLALLGRDAKKRHKEEKNNSREKRSINNSISKANQSQRWPPYASLHNKQVFNSSGFLIFFLHSLRFDSNPLSVSRNTRH